MTFITSYGTDQASVIPQERPDESLWDMFFGVECKGSPTARPRYTRDSDFVVCRSQADAIAAVIESKWLGGAYKYQGYVSALERSLDGLSVAIGKLAGAPTVIEYVNRLTMPLICGHAFGATARNLIIHDLASYALDDSFGNQPITIAVEPAVEASASAQEITQDDHKLLMSALYAGSKLLYEF